MMQMSVGILVGGKSSRMGENKARLQYKNQSFLEKIASVCDGFTETLISVDDTDKYQDIPYRLVQDEISSYGPLEGIYQLLCHIHTEYVLVLATDMPLVQRDLLQALANQVGKNEDCVVLCVDKKPQAMCSIYSKKVLPILQEMRVNGEHKPRMLFQKVNTKYVDIEELGFSKELVDNINTKEDYYRLR